MNFAQALQGLLSGEYASISCDAWNGKGMFVFRAKAPCFDAHEGLLVDIMRSHNEIPGLLGAEPCLALRGADGTVTLGWTPSQRDLFSEDWCGRENRVSQRDPELLEKNKRFQDLLGEFARRQQAVGRDGLEGNTPEIMRIRDELFEMVAGPSPEDVVVVSDEAPRRKAVSLRECLAYLKTKAAEQLPPADKFELLLRVCVTAHQEGPLAAAFHADTAFTDFLLTLLAHPHNVKRDSARTLVWFHTLLQRYLQSDESRRADLYIQLHDYVRMLMPPSA